MFTATRNRLTRSTTPPATPTRPRPAWLVASLVLLLGGSSCESCDSGGGSGSGTSSGGGWLIGQSGLMVNLPHDRPGVMDHYDLDLTDDFLGIACRGTREAWVVGAAGLVIATADAGATWSRLDAGVKTSLRAVALAATDTIFVAGDAGAFLVSHDGGARFQPLAAPTHDYTSVAARRTDGAVALLASRQGEIHRYDARAGTITPVVADDGGALWSVVLSRDGVTAVAVGDGGRLLVSRDGGLSFQAQAAGGPDTLRDVWLIGDHGDRLMAVGDGGLVLRGATGTSAPERQRLGAGAATLRALHLEASGHGAIVGDRGTLFTTTDAGRSWQPILGDERRDFFGLDALDAGPHL